MSSSSSQSPSKIGTTGTTSSVAIELKMIEYADVAWEDWNSLEEADEGGDILLLQEPMKELMVEKMRLRIWVQGNTKEGLTPVTLKSSQESLLQSADSATWSRRCLSVQT